MDCTKWAISPNIWRLTQSYWTFNTCLTPLRCSLVSSYLPRSHPWRSPICSWCESSHQATCTSFSGGCRCRGQRGRPDWSGCCCAGWWGWSDPLRSDWTLWKWYMIIYSFIKSSKDFFKFIYCLLYIKCEKTVKYSLCNDIKQSKVPTSHFRGWNQTMFGNVAK